MYVKNIKTNSFHKEVNEDTKTLFYTKTGKLSEYALACGYIESVELNGVILTLEKDSACIHIKGYNNNIRDREFWDSYDTLTEARKEYTKRINQYK